MEDRGPDLLALGSSGQLLRIEILGPYAADALDSEVGDWLEAAIHVEAFPFSGRIRTVLTADDVTQLRHALTQFHDSGRATVGGGRGPVITLLRDGQVVEVTVTPSGDDPQPFLRYSIFPVAD